jgi:hypothetical protein
MSNFLLALHVKAEQKACFVAVDKAAIIQITRQLFPQQQQEQGNERISRSSRHPIYC